MLLKAIKKSEQPYLECQVEFEQIKSKYKDYKKMQNTLYHYYKLGLDYKRLYLVHDLLHNDIKREVERHTQPYFVLITENYELQNFVNYTVTKKPDQIKNHGFGKYASSSIEKDFGDGTRTDLHNLVEGIPQPPIDRYKFYIYKIMNYASD